MGQLQVELVRTYEGARGAPEQYSFEMSACTKAPGHLDHATQRRSERRFVDTGALHVTADAEETSARRLGCANGCERRPAFKNDVWNVEQSLDVVDDGRFAEKADVYWKRRLVSRLTPLPFDRLEQCGFLTTNVGSGPAPDLDIEGQVATKDV